MVQGVEHIPPELEVLALRNMEVFAERRIQIPKTGSTEIGQQRTRLCEQPGAGVFWSVIGPKVLVVPEDGFESGRVDPVRNPLCFRAGAAQARVSDNVDSAAVIGFPILQ